MPASRQSPKDKKQRGAARGKGTVDALVLTAEASSEPASTHLSRSSSGVVTPENTASSTSSTAATITGDEMALIRDQLHTLSLRHADPRAATEMCRGKLPLRVARLPVLAPIPTLPSIPEDHRTRVFVFGMGEQAELGLGDEMVERRKPMPLKSVDERRPVDISTGGQTGFVLGENGEAYSWGASDSFAVGRVTEENRDTMVQFLQRERHKPASSEMEMAIAETEWEPAVVPPSQLDGLRIVQVACGDAFTVLLTEIGTVYQAGIVRGGDGNIHQSTRHEFTLVHELLMHTIVDVVAGNNHVLAVTDRGFVYSWGNGEQQQFGRRASQRMATMPARTILGIQPRLVPNIARIVRVGAGGYHSFAIDIDGRLYAWGMNSYGQLCVGIQHGVEEQRVAIPMLVDPAVFGGREVAYATGGEHHSLILMRDGTLFACGRSDSGQLGLSLAVRQPPLEQRNPDTQTSAVMVPMPITTGLSAQVVQVSAATDHNVAICADGTAHCWGYGDQYALGTAPPRDSAPDTTVPNEPEPVRLAGQKLNGWRLIRCAAAGNHTYVLGIQEGDPDDLD